MLPPPTQVNLKKKKKIRKNLRSCIIGATKRYGFCGQQKGAKNLYSVHHQRTKEKALNLNFQKYFLQTGHSNAFV